EHAELARAFPGRLLLGIGIGHPEATSDYSRPLSTMRQFFDGLDSAVTPVPRDERAVAALGPKMLDLCADRSLGTLTYFTPVEHTRFARERVGENGLVATELACVLDVDDDRARATAREYAALYLGLRNYTTNLLRFGFTEQDIAGGGSDRLIDAIIPHGTAEEIAAVAREHLDAGANHVCLQTVGISGIPREQWTAVAAALIRWGPLGGSRSSAEARASADDSERGPHAEFPVTRQRAPQVVDPGLEVHDPIPALAWRQLRLGGWVRRGAVAQPPGVRLHTALDLLETDRSRLDDAAGEQEA